MKDPKTMKDFEAIGSAFYKRKNVVDDKK